MGETSRRRTGEFLRKLFEILGPHLDGLPSREALAEVERQIPLSEYEKGFFESGGRRFDQIVRFATVDCVKAGWLTKSKGRWNLTEEGRKAYNDFRDPEVFYKTAVRLYHEWKSTRPDSETAGEEAGGATGSKAASITFEQAEEQAWAEIESYLRAMKPYDFQELVAALLRAMGYFVSWVSPPGRDGGLDVLAWTDPLGTRPPRIKVQVKRTTATVTVDGLRSFMALLGDDDVGLFVCIGGFTKDAEEEARTQEKRKITLIDLERLFDLWVQHYPRLEEEARRRLPLQPIYFLAPET